MRNTYVRGNMLIRNFKLCEENVKVKLYKTYCSSVYCCALISVFHKGVLRKLHTAFNKIFKNFMNVPRDYSARGLFVSLNVENFTVLRRKLVFNFISRCQTSNNVLVGTIISSMFFEKCTLKKEWDKILYY